MIPPTATSTAPSSAIGADLGVKMAKQLEEVILTVGPDELGAVIVDR